ncbi:ABC-F family ATP-binding cassette domain-containing protein [Candidatus Saccharibacteria bacterium]|nr:ABC-F family ATP-binding cassette domain-containing protein [Candidatus Saccharibacteria bacterium]
MIADITITEKSFGPKSLYKNLSFSVGDSEKIGVIGRNGVGKSTLFGILSGEDTDFTGDVIFRRGVSLVSSRQEHHGHEQKTVLEYILGDLPEYAHLSHIIETYPETMGDNVRKISEYTDALERFGGLGYYDNEGIITEDLKRLQIGEAKAHGLLGELSGGQKRLVEVVKIMHSNAHLALIDEPTNHMDYLAKTKFIDWMKNSNMAMLIITHDRDVLHEVDRIIEIKDGEAVVFNGNYDYYLKTNATSTTGAMHEFEVMQRRIANLKDKVIQFRRLKEKARDPDTIKQFKRREQQATSELSELQMIEKPTFWIDQNSVTDLGLKSAEQYDKFKAKNIKIHGAKVVEGHSRLLVEVQDLSLGYTTPLFEKISFQLREGERIELHGRNGAGKTTLIKKLLEYSDWDAAKHLPIANSHISTVLNQGVSKVICYAGTIEVDSKTVVGVYEQEVSHELFELSLQDAIERVYLNKNLPITDTKIRQLLADYLFTAGDGSIPVKSLSGGQKSRLQLIAMLANNPSLLVLDEPTNHLDLPSIEELENALHDYRGAILYVSHDSYFQKALGGVIVQIGKT